MAPRKDMMRIIRRDAGFSATLVFGEGASTQAAANRGAEMESSADAGAPQVHAPRDRSVEEERSVNETPGRVVGSDGQEPNPPATKAGTPSAATAFAARGTVVYVAVSLTARQATLAEAWAKAARCTVPFLIRHVAQSIRDRTCDDWQRDGMPEIAERRGTRGRFPTSVTLTLPPGFAAELAARHDPLGIVGLGRAMGPAFRARFEAEFDAALARMGIGARGARE